MNAVLIQRDRDGNLKRIYPLAADIQPDGVVRQYELSELVKFAPGDWATIALLGPEREMVRLPEDTAW